jgi:hypothetical protein
VVLGLLGACVLDALAVPRELWAIPIGALVSRLLTPPRR